MVSQVHNSWPCATFSCLWNLSTMPLLWGWNAGPPCFTPTRLQKAAHTAPENGGPLYEEISMGSPNRETQLSTRLVAQLSAVVLERGITSAHLVDLYCCKNVQAPLVGHREKAHEVTVAILAVPGPPRDICCQTKRLAIILLEAWTLGCAIPWTALKTARWHGRSSRGQTALLETTHRTGTPSTWKDRTESKEEESVACLACKLFPSRQLKSMLVAAAATITTCSEALAAVADVRTNQGVLLCSQADSPLSWAQQEAGRACQLWFWDLLRCA